MSANVERITLQTGADMPPEVLDSATGQISEWLTEAQGSISRTQDEILADVAVGESYFMTNGGHLLGYFALRPFKESVYGTISGGAVRSLWRMPHFGVQSMVVNPNERGRRLGDRLVSEACMVATGITREVAPGAAYSLVSAVSRLGSSSMAVFGRQGFLIERSSIVANEHNYTSGKLRTAGKAAVSKVVQVGPRQPAMREKLLN